MVMRGKMRGTMRLVPHLGSEEKEMQIIVWMKNLQFDALGWFVVHTFFTDVSLLPSLLGPVTR